MIDTLVDEIMAGNNLRGNLTMQYEICKRLGLWNLIRFKMHHLLISEKEQFEDYLIERGFSGIEIEYILRLKAKIDKVLLIYGIRVKSGKWAIANYKEKKTKRIVDYLMHKVQTKYGKKVRKVFYQVLKEEVKKEYGIDIRLQNEKIDIYRLLMILRSYKFKMSLLYRLRQHGILEIFYGLQGLDADYAHLLAMQAKSSTF